ncbi:MAG: hypothetical protein DMG72_14150 [Acidobacteria bacterium]|nr:MAG: hypothetical protein DMG72_14150 [Acidobacteriota bacterium]
MPDSENIRTTRISLGVLGDGFVEAVADETLIELARKECKESHRKICGQVIYVPIVEAPGQTGIGRFGSLFITRTSRLPTEQRSSLVALW